MSWRLEVGGWVWLEDCGVVMAAEVVGWWAVWGVEVLVEWVVLEEVVWV